MRDLILTTLFALVLSFCTLAETSVWKVEANGSTLYLGGTFHALRAADYPLPAQFGEAFANSDVLVFETNIAELISPSFQQRMLQRGVYRDGSTLQTVLSAPTYQQLNEYCQDAGIPVSSIIRLRPPMAVLTLLGLELHKLGVTQSGVDLHFYQEAGKAGKPTEWLEGVDEQIDFIMSMGEGHEDDFVRHSLRDLKQTREVLAELIDAWQRGDEADLER